VHRDDKAVRPTSFGVIFTDNSGERVRELTHERGAVSRLGEPHFGIEPERGERLVGPRRPLMSAPVSRTSRAASASSQRADSRSGDRAGSGATAASAAGEIT